MKIIYRKDFDLYRMVVGKLAFLDIHNEYKLVKNIDFSNVMLLEDANNKFFASIFRMPSVGNLRKFPIRIYYQSQKFKVNGHKAIKKYEKIPNDVETFELSDDFDNKYDDYFKKAMLNPEKLLKEIDRDHLGLIEKYFLNSNYSFKNSEENARKHSDLKEFREYFDKEDKRLLIYKYISKDTVSDHRHRVNDGDLSFSHPDNFNDPFDCNCLLSNDVSVMDRFRVLCMTPIYNNILMWSHYANEHTGYCFGYSFDDVISKIEHLNNNGLCLIGFVNYERRRPRQKSSLPYFSYSDLKFYIDSTFTKFIDWQYEKEFRFVLIVDKENIDKAYRAVKDEDIPKESHVNNFIPINCNVVERYNGIKGDGMDIATYNGPESVTKLRKDDRNYSIYK